ncbi:hypothetical protein TYRP_020227 [Tyrophagus putrescentiae]|nr:hypothetical protein TYRP_020227 [Tyrophagus putrescentiae]
MASSIRPQRALTTEAYGLQRGGGHRIEEGDRRFGGDHVKVRSLLVMSRASSSPITVPMNGSFARWYSKVGRSQRTYCTLTEAAISEMLKRCCTSA